MTGKILKKRGWKEGRIIGLAKMAGHALEQQGLDEAAILDRLDEVLAAPEKFTAEKPFEELAAELLKRERSDASKIADTLLAEPLGFQTWGADFIDGAATQQMSNAMSLPIAVAGALMPDAHVGYGLPIGGVLATSETVIPYAVGVDIACRMRISIYDASPHILGQHKGKFEKSLSEQTKFGMKERFSPRDRPDHPVLDDEDWRATNFLKPLRQKAIEQLGTSGGGNHFVEWGEFELTAPSPELGLGIGKYLALLSHSGSRAVGFKIANEFSRLAMSLHPKLDQVVKHLAWLDLNSDAGRDYWLSMELAGRFAAANHAIIHSRVSKAAGVKEVAHVENHHNFAWKETMADGSEAIVHRKGATPAGQGVLGVIPGSMADPGFVVRGLGKVESLNSASHGAGRKLGRKAAINSLTKLERDRYLQERGVKLLGGGLDEAPQAYKNIDDVIAAQTDLVEVIGKFTPRIVRMADEAGNY
ncbi:MAG: RtcB family protein [Armatimonadetes bacterium]|nr:RtcB family protein [Armatimonadota bacterium]